MSANNGKADAWKDHITNVSLTYLSI